MIYFDNAATSWPKPPGMAEAMVHFTNNVGANPGRSGHHLAVDAGRIVYDTREAVAELFNAPDPLRVVFGHNVTEALNLALRGLLRPGDHVVTTSMEHNSMMRPLRALERQGVELTIRAHEEAVTQRLIDGLRDIPGATVYGGLDATRQTATVSFNVAGMEPSEVGLRLDEDYGIMCRVGLHCAPAAHKTIGTFPVGTVRFGLGAFNTLEEVDAAVAAVEHLAQEAQ